VTVVGLGLVMADVIVRAESLPIAESDPAVSSIELRLGGSTANILAGMAQLGHETVLVSAVGTDRLGEMLRAELSAAGIGHRRVTVTPGRSASCVAIETAAGRTLMWHLPAEIEDAVGDVSAVRADLADAGAVHVNGRFPVAAARLCEMAGEAGVPVSVNAGRGDVGRDVAGLVGHATVLVASDDWAISHTGASGKDAAEEACRRLAACPGPALVSVTCGEAGSWTAARHGRPVHTPAVPLAGAGTTGLGDAYHAGLLDAFLSGARPHEAAARGAEHAARLNSGEAAIDGRSAA
jgi:sugar/nucleoside kinase (ribokinase family)